MLMNRLVWKLLRRHISAGQLAGFFLASLFGMTIVLLSVQGYRDVIPLFSAKDSFMKNGYVVATKRITALGNIAGRSNTFSEQEIEDLRRQPFTRSVGRFTPSLFHVSAGVGMERTAMRLSTQMFFESVPDSYVDVATDRWTFEADSCVIPIIVPRNYLNLYNFGFAQSRNLPKLSEGVMGLVRMNIVLEGNGRSERMRGQIVGFSDRLNTILVPQTFMDWANRTFAPGQEAQPSRLVLEVKNPADAALATYFQQHGYEAENNDLDAGKTAYFLRLVTGLVAGVGLVISLLSFYILMLSIYLLLQKNATKLENLLLLGYSPGQVAYPYTVLTMGLNLLVWGLSTGIVCLVRGSYFGILQTIYPPLERGTLLPTLIVGFALTVLVTALNVGAIRRNVHKLC